MPQHGQLEVVTVVTGPFRENCHLLADLSSGQALIIDPGDDPEAIVARLEQHGWTAAQIACTHAHIDHVGAVAPLKRMLGIDLAIHQAEGGWLAHIPVQASMFGLAPKQVPTVERYLTAGDELRVGNARGVVLETPGHTPGGCSFYFAAAGVVFVGDTLFAGSIGRTDLPGGDGPTLLASIHAQLLTLPDQVVVYSGHGPSTTIGRERRRNPFLRGAT